ncbi:hypothetical protein ACLOJK_011102 [Asimina triloba]
MASQIRSAHAQPKILLLPYLAKGHFYPFIALATLLEQKTSAAITIITTPLNIPTIRSSLPPNSAVRLASLPFNAADHGLPPHAENTHLLPPHLVSRFLMCTQTLKSSLDLLIADICARDGRPPLCIVSDLLMSWSVDPARKHGLLHFTFRTFGAYAIRGLLSAIMTKDQSQLFSDSVAGTANDSFLEYCNKLIAYSEQSGGLLYNTVEELEKKTLDHFRIASRRVWAIGPMTLARNGESRSLLSCVEWLDKQTPSSVLYISFGSENCINPPQMRELAKGLEQCGTPFVWVVRPPVECENEFFPAGFEERMSERKQGMFFKTWAPQVEILGHESTGAFLSHCGWNSTLESLSHGVPIIGWPLNMDQFFNSKMVEEELGVGVEIAQGCDAEINGAEVARVVGMVMDGESENGTEMRKKAREIEEAMKSAMVDEKNFKGSSVEALENFLQTIAA